MNRILLKSLSFIRLAKKLIKKSPHITKDIHSTLELLEKDAFSPLLRTHKLTGVLENSWACSVGYDLRIIFKFVKYQGKEAILLEAIGTHDEVY